jgi:hypothetical protein
MSFKERLEKIKEILTLIFKSPEVEINLSRENPLSEKYYKYFTRPHDTIKIIKNKVHGMALLEVAKFRSSNDYINSVNGKNSAAYYTRKAERVGYKFEEIDPYKLKEEIFEINTSASERQNRKMSESYLNKDYNYPIDDYNSYYGVFKEGKLVAYIWLSRMGEVTVVMRILGHNDFLKDGIMYFLTVNAVTTLINAQKKEKYLLYDSFLGNTKGLELFKTRLGFSPFHVKWRLKETTD